MYGIYTHTHTSSSGSLSLLRLETSPLLLLLLLLLLFFLFSSFLFYSPLLSFIMLFLFPSSSHLLLLAWLVCLHSERIRVRNTVDGVWWWRVDNRSRHSSPRRQSWARALGVTTRFSTVSDPLSLLPLNKSILNPIDVLMARHPNNIKVTKKKAALQDRRRWWTFEPCVLNIFF